MTSVRGSAKTQSVGPAREENKFCIRAVFPVLADHQILRIGSETKEAAAVSFRHLCPQIDFIVIKNFATSPFGRVTAGLINDPFKA